MKKLIFIFLTLLIVGCATTRKTVFFERVTPQPLSVIDSLNTVHGLNVPTQFQLADAATVTVVLPLPPESGVAVIKSF